MCLHTSMTSVVLLEMKCTKTTCAVITVSPFLSNNICIFKAYVLSDYLSKVKFPNFIFWSLILMGGLYVCTCNDTSWSHLPSREQIIHLYSQSFKVVFLLSYMPLVVHYHLNDISTFAKVVFAIIM